GNRKSDDRPVGGALARLSKYTRAGGNCSVTGGYVSRGTAIPALRGAYLFSDYCAGQVRAVATGEDGAPAATVVLSSQPRSVASFGEGDDGELYVCWLDGNAVYRIDPA